MKKFLLVVLIGMVLAIDIYGFVKDYEVYKAEKAKQDEIGTVVYVE